MKITVSLSVLLVGVAVARQGAASDVSTPLDAYVRRDDGAYRWDVSRTGTVRDVPYAELRPTSQEWRGREWRHQLFVLRPADGGSGERALLLISGGSQDDLEAPAESPPSDVAEVARVVERLGTPVAVLRQVPNQPLLGGLYEDAIIAKTFGRFLETGDPTWPLLLPMVKSAVRAMDAVQAHAEEAWGQRIRAFTVTGASKRGWTSWLTAAVDERVSAVAPMVIDVVNMADHLDYQQKVWGGYSEKIGDYTERGLPAKLETEAGRALREIVDPYFYRKRLRQPKLIVVGTNDRYWPVDALRLYWDELPGPKHVLYVPNARHNLGDMRRVVGTLAAFHRRAADRAMPDVQAAFEVDGGSVRMQLTAEPRPETARAWVAETSDRDFRDAQWRPHELAKRKDGFVYERRLPKKGSLALFGETVYEPEGAPFFLSTQMKVVETGGRPKPDDRSAAPGKGR